MGDLISWPPSYSVRKSKKAKYVHLQYSEARGLEVVIPERRRRKVNPIRLLNEHKAWVISRQKEFAVYDRALHSQVPPETLKLPAIDELWHIQKAHQDSDKLSLEVVAENCLLLKGNTRDRVLVRKVFRSWLHQKGHVHLTPWLESLSERTGLKFRKISIRGQKTRWGSCSANKDISLNWKLLFLEKEIANHIMLHELCHLKYLDHSESFWQFLTEFDENCEQNRQLCRLAEDDIPRWLE